MQRDAPPRGNNAYRDAAKNKYSFVVARQHYSSCLRQAMAHFSLFLRRRCGPRVALSPISNILPIIVKMGNVLVLAATTRESETHDMLMAFRDARSHFWPLCRP